MEHKKVDWVLLKNTNIDSTGHVVLTEKQHAHIVEMLDYFEKKLEEIKSKMNN